MTLALNIILMAVVFSVVVGARVDDPQLPPSTPGKARTLSGPPARSSPERTPTGVELTRCGRRPDSRVLPQYRTRYARCLPPANSTLLLRRRWGSRPAASASASG